MIDMRDGAQETPDEPLKAKGRTSKKSREESALLRHQHEQTCLAQHSSKSWEHYTPVDYVEAIRKTMGTIDLDPASCWLAQQDINAGTWHGLQEDNTMTDGLAVPWHGNVFLNPPGGNTWRVRAELQKISRSYPVVWWRKLVAEWRAGTVKQAIFVGFSLEMLVNTQGTGQDSMLDFPFCVPRKRIQFDYPLDTYEGRPLAGTERKVGTDPTHGNVIVYLPERSKTGLPERSKTGCPWLEGTFYENFSVFGRVLNAHND